MSSELTNSIIQRYLIGKESLRSIGTSLGLSHRAVSGYLVRNGVARRPRSSKGKKQPRCYSVDDHFFDCIDTEDKAYWLGFLLADGCVRGGCNTISIGLKTSDAPHLQKFANSLLATYPVKIYGGSCPMAQICISSRHMAETLRLYGIVANAKFPFSSHDELSHHYWRGCIDGDGCLSIQSTMRKSGTAYLCNRVMLVGTKETVESFRNWCCKLCDSKAKVHRHRNIWEFTLVGNNSDVICNKLYSSAHTYLDRKYDIYKKMLLTSAPLRMRLLPITAA